MRSRRIVVGMPGRSSLSPYMVLSVLLHLVVVGAWILFPGFGSTAAPPEDVFFVDVVGGVPSTPAAQVKPPPPKETPPPEPEPEPEGARVETREVATPKPEEKKPEPEPEKPRPTPPPAPRSNDVKPSRDSEQQPATGGTTGSGDPDASITSLDLGDMEHAWYRDSVVMALRNHWARPILQGIRQTLEVTLAFEIARDGSVLRPRIESSSGVPSLDRSALRAVADASPLPPLPHSWRDPVVAARFVFRLQPGAD